VIGLTLRHDRLDNFWFTLTHEVAHIYRHLDGNYAFFDDIETGLPTDCHPQEAEANELAREALIPSEVWKREKDRLLTTTREEEVIEFAEDLSISPAIVAGRIRWETKDYSRFTGLIGSHRVKKMFGADVLSRTYSSNKNVASA
jgi:HTH-type transcriptional regulator/antitoxin HigA